MIELARMQLAFKRALLERETAALSAHLLNEQPERSTKRISIYAEAYRLRLKEALLSNYPQLVKWLGLESFDALAELFIDAHPSPHFSIRWFGQCWPDVLAHSFSDQPWIAELARWEWALGTCFDALDATTLTAQQVGNFAPEEWPSLRFDLHPSVQVFAASTNAPQVYKALAEDQAPPAPQQTMMSHWLIWRRDLVPCYRSLDAAEHAALATIDRGAPFEVLCTVLSEHHPSQDVGSRAAALLRDWLDARLLCAVRSS